MELDILDLCIRKIRSGYLNFEGALEKKKILVDTIKAQKFFGLFKTMPWIKNEAKSLKSSLE